MQEPLISKAKIQSFVTTCRHFNVPPVFLSQYYAAQKSHPVSRLLAELMDECADLLLIMTDEEVDRLVHDLPVGFKMSIERRPVVGDTRPWFERVALYYVAAQCQQHYFSLRGVVVFREEESVVLRTYPELKDRMDDDGLLRMDDDLRLFDGGIEYKDHILHYHQFLRRGYHSNPNYDFLGRFSRYYHQSSERNRFRIAIDHRRLMPREHYLQIGEYDAWFGPPFDPKELDDPNAIGLTVMTRSRPSEFDLYGDRIDRTEFYWSFRDGIKTLEVEELSSADVCHDDAYYLNRYVHSQRDTARHVLQHFDGAVKVYLKDRYQERLANQMPKDPRSYQRIKLFRIDGDIEVAEWIELICLFYKLNEMVVEYLNPEYFSQMFAERTRKYQAAMA
jgi:hypothetical protein